MIHWKIKIDPNKSQKRLLNEWFDIGTSIYNWSVRKLQADAEHGIWYSQHQFNNILVGHCEKIGIANAVLQGLLVRAWRTFKVCQRKNKGVHPSKWARPKLRGKKRPLATLPLPHPSSIRMLDRNHVMIARIGRVRFHPVAIPAGKIKCGAIQRKPSGYYLCLIIDAPAQKIDCLAGELVGIDPGFKDLLNLSTGEKINNPPEIQAAIERVQARLVQAQRGRDYKLVRRLYEKLQNLRKQRNHLISKDLVRRFDVIAIAKDNEAAMARARKVRNKSGQKVRRSYFAKSVTASTHCQIRLMLTYKAKANNRTYYEVDGNNTTRQCSTCLGATGPTGLDGLKERIWTCEACGARHDRDTNAAINILLKALASERAL